MTLRLRLVVGLVVLVTLGLAVFGVVTYSLYSHSEYDRLDDQLRAAVPLVTNQLREAAGLSGPRPGFGGTNRATEPGGGERPQPPIVVPPGTYAELRDPSGAIVSNVALSNSSQEPKLATKIRTTATRGTFSTTGSVSGSTEWRTLVIPSDFPRGDTVVIAVPLTEVSASLRRLIYIEVAAAGGLLAILGIGAWLILRRGLRPLEHMATSARGITAGDLSHRVPVDGRTEVGQLGLALNTMLGEIETAFQAREESEQRLRQFLADVSHELRTPLTSIQGFAELFRLGADDRVQLGVILRRIEEESIRMGALVDDLLLLARLDETRPSEREPVDLAVLAADACSDAVAVTPDRRVTLDAPDPVVVLGDRDHLRQAIANLVGNATHHTPPGTPIEVTAKVDGGYAVVAVRDFGRGLDDEALVRVFDRFWRADEARVGDGAGLGLSIVAGIAEEHGGRASAENADGAGPASCSGSR